MIDLTPLAEALITLAATAISVFLIPWLKTRYSNEKLAKAQAWVRVGVYAAEKLFGAGHGDEKLAYAEDFLAAHKIKLDTATLKALVNAEIRKMEQEEVVIEAVEVPALPDENEPAPGGGLDG